MTKTDMPPLPEPSEMDGARWGYTADDVRNYGVDAYDAGVAAERERCAKVCEVRAPDSPSYFEIAERLRECAAEIRGA